MTTGRAPPILLDDFTERELEVLQMAADGLTNGAIAEKLLLSVNSVNHYFSNAFEKVMDTGSHGGAARTKAVADALRLGLIE